MGRMTGIRRILGDSGWRENEFPRATTLELGSHIDVRRGMHSILVDSTYTRWRDDYLF